MGTATSFGSIRKTGALFGNIINKSCCRINNHGGSDDHKNISTMKLWLQLLQWQELLHQTKQYQV